MAFVLKNPPEFTVEVNQWTRETDADGAEMAKEIEKLLNNEVYLKTELERQERVALVALSADGWTGEEAPYSQTVAVSGAEERMEPALVSALEAGADGAAQKAYSKAFALVSSGTARVGDGTATFQVYKKPAVDLVVGLKGV